MFNAQSILSCYLSFCFVILGILGASDILQYIIFSGLPCVHKRQGRSTIVLITKEELRNVPHRNLS